MENLDGKVYKYITNKDENILEEILIDTKGMIFHVINRYYSNNCHFDKIDYYQMIAMRYPEWIQKFAEKNNVKFATFLYACARNYFLKLLKRESTQKRNMKNVSYLEDKTSGSGYYYDIISDGINIEKRYLSEIETKTLYDYLYKTFGDNAKYYIGYLEGYKVSVLSQIYNEDVNEIRRIIRMIKKRLQNLILKP